MLQEAHTYFSGDTSSRLDRSYISYNECDHALFSPVAYVPLVPFLNLKTRFNAKSHRHLEDDIGAPDHLPIGVRFESTDPKKIRGFHIPKWMGTSPDFAQQVRTKWLSHDLAEFGLDPSGAPLLGAEALRSKQAFKARKLFHRCIVETTKSYLSENSGKAYQDELAKISLSLRLLRMCDDPSTDRRKIDAFLRRHPNVAEELSVTVTTKELFDFLRSKVDSMVGGFAHGDLTDNSTVRSAVPGDNNPIKQAKRILPSQRKRLVAIQGPNGEVVTEPQEMAWIIGDQWGPVWTMRSTGPPDVSVSDIFRGYRSACRQFK